jgi:hypothetical protein
MGFPVPPLLAYVTFSEGEAGQRFLLTGWLAFFKKAFNIFPIQSQIP